MRRLRNRGGICALVACMVSVGCGAPAPESSTEAPSPRQEASPSGEPADDGLTVSWADSYCGAMTELVKSVSALPTVDSSSAERASETSSELLRVVVGGLDRTLDRLDGLAAAPVAGAERVRSEAIEVYSDIRDRATGVLDDLEAATGAEASRQAVGAVKEPLDDIGARNLLEGFDSVPQLREVSSEAPACRQLLDSDTTPRLDSPGS